MASTISSSGHRLPVNKRRLKPLSLRDYLLDDLSSCSSNGFKSIPRHQSTSTADIKRRLTCGLAFSHAVQKASTALLSAVKLLPLPSSSVNPPSRKKRIFSISFSRHLWKKLSNVDGEMETRKQEIQRCRSFADFLKESLDDQPSDEDTLSNAAGGDSSSFGSELFTNSELTKSSSETSNKNDAVEDVTEETSEGGVVMMSGDCVGSHVSEGSSSVNDNREESVNEEKDQLSPISILECPFEDDAINPPNSHQKEIDEKNLMRKVRGFESTIVRLEPVDLRKRIEKDAETQDYYSHKVETEEDRSENRANRLLALVKSRLTEEPSHLLASQKVDSLLLDFFKEDGHNETRDEDKLVKTVEEWVLRRQEEECMFMSWEVRGKRDVYVKEMKWGRINGEETDYVVEELRNNFVTYLIDELILDLSL